MINYLSLSVSINVLSSLTIYTLYLSKLNKTSYIKSLSNPLIA